MSWSAPWSAPLASPYRRGQGKIDRARNLRSDMTDAEKRLWCILRGDRMGVRFRRQLVIDRRYIAGFCAPAVSLIVEVDGGQHLDNPDDALRTAYLERRGYRVLRFWNTDVLLATQSVAQAILTAVHEVAATARPPKWGPSGDVPPPSPPGRGAGGGVRAGRATP